MLQEFGKEIWIAAGPKVTVLGFDYSTRMAVLRMADGGLFIWSPTPFSPAMRYLLDTLGPVRHIVAPNSLHHLFLADWVTAYPDALLHGTVRLQRKRRDLQFDARLTDTPAPDWAEEVDQVLVGGNLLTSEAVFFHRPSATVLFTDLLQQLPSDWYKGWRAKVARLDLMVSPEPTVPRKFRAACINRRAARKAVTRILDWPVEKVLMAHGTPVESGARALLHRAFAWLTG